MKNWHRVGYCLKRGWCFWGDWYPNAYDTLIPLIHFNNAKCKWHKKNAKWNMLLQEHHGKSKLHTDLKFFPSWWSNRLLKKMKKQFLSHPDVSVTIATPSWHQSWITEVLLIYWKMYLMFLLIVCKISFCLLWIQKQTIVMLHAYQTSNMFLVTVCKVSFCLF